MMNQLPIFIHIYSSLFMCGLIWLIQLVHYPGFLFIDKERYIDFQRFHMLRISWIVIPIMSLELVSGVSLCYLKSSHLWTVNLLLILLIWMSTLLIQSPVHGKLEKGYSEQLIKRLIQGNWIRTILWTVHTFLVVMNVHISLI